MYASHPIPPCTPEGEPGYVTTQIKTRWLTGDADTFRQGAAAFRNARDWAKPQRCDAIKPANESEATRPHSSSTEAGLGLVLASDASGGMTTMEANWMRRNMATAIAVL